jgi:hypothetical protein
MYAKQMNETQAHAWLDDVLADMGANGKRRPRAKIEAAATA